MGLSGYQKAPDCMNGTSGREAAIFSGQSPRKNVVPSLTEPCVQDTQADGESYIRQLSWIAQAYYRSLYGQARMRIQNEFEPGRAVELLDEFIADEPESDNMQSVAHACWRKGNAFEQLGRKQDEREAYEESLRRDPSLELAKRAIASLQE